MSWQSRWPALSARISALHEVGLFLASMGSEVDHDYLGVIDSDVIPNAQEVFRTLQVMSANDEGEWVRIFCGGVKARDFKRLSG